MLFNSKEERIFVSQMFNNAIFNNVPAANIISLNNILAQGKMIDEAYAKEVPKKDKAIKAKGTKVVDMPESK